ncbi:MAG: hypothetical protein JW727_02540 [Candidatus Aenigmarchaeota archaeon]|nr:hypothetical protein [Candidatus Aenigmarchaeota archaeon]
MKRFPQILPGGADLGVNRNNRPPYDLVRDDLNRYAGCEIVNALSTDSTQWPTRSFVESASKWQSRISQKEAEPCGLTTTYTGSPMTPSMRVYFDSTSQR